MFKHLVLIVVLTLLVFVAAGFGIQLSGSPMENRAIRYDEIRMNDFNSVKTGIESYYQDNLRVPQTLGELTADRIKTKMPYMKKIPKDPATKVDYTYTPVGTAQYKICAIFETSSSEIEKRKTGIIDPLTSTELYGEDKSHPIGNFCFSRSVSSYLQDQYGAGSSRINNYQNNISPPPPLSIPQDVPNESTSGAF
jgi:hypothetical protein